MKFGLRSTVVLLFVCSLTVGAITEETAAQGPLLTKLRSFNGGRPLLPFVPESKPIKPPAKEPTLAKKPATATKKSTASRTPTPATKKETTSLKKPTLAKEATTGANASTAAQTKKFGDDRQTKVDQTLAAKGFGMWIQESRERFFVSQINPRGNAAAAGLQRGDLIVNIGGAPLKVLDEYAAIAKAMRGGDRVDFEVSRRGSKPKEVAVQYGKAPPVKQPPLDKRTEQVSTPASPTTIVRKPARYEPEATSRLRSVYEGSGTPSSVFEPTPARRSGHREVEPLEIELPSLDFD